MPVCSGNEAHNNQKAIHKKTRKLSVMQTVDQIKLKYVKINSHIAQAFSSCHGDEEYRIFC